MLECATLSLNGVDDDTKVLSVLAVAVAVAVVVVVVTL